MKYFTLVICLLLIFSIFPAYAFGCSIAVSQVTKFNPNEYIFIGRVIGVTDKYEPDIPKNQKDAIYNSRGSSFTPEERLKFFRKNFTSSALVVKVIYSIYSPEKLTETVEVFPLNLRGPCYYLGWEKEIITKKFPIGSRINIMATKSEIYQNRGSSDNLKLEVQWTQSISRTKILGNEFDSSFNAKTDYQALVEPRKHIGKGVLDFELRKEFVRLEFEKPKDKVKTLERLAYFPYPFSYYYIVNNHLDENNSSTQQLLSLRKKYEEDFLK